MMVAQGDNFATGAVVTQTAQRTPRTVRSPRLAPVGASRAMRIAVVLMHVAGSTSAAAGKASVQASMFGSTKSVADWFSQTSGGQVTVTGTVYGYYPGVRSCDLSTQLAAGAAAAASGGYRASDYDHLVVYTPDQGCPFAGMGWIGESGVFLNGDTSPGVVEHELGHNLGLWHAGAYMCGSAPISASCLVEYGDQADVMGAPETNHGYSAEHKRMLGWIPVNEVRTVTSGVAIVALTASEHPRIAGAIELIHLRAPDGTLFAIDRRSSVGYDAGLSGVWIRKVGSVGSDDVELVRDSALPAGATFADPVHHVSVTVLTDHGSTASVQVCVGPCGASVQSQGVHPVPRPLGATSVATASRSAVANGDITLRVPAGRAVAIGRTVVVTAYAGAAPGAVSCRDSRGNSYAINVNRVGARRVVVCSARLRAVLPAGGTITVTYPRFRGASLAVAGAFTVANSGPPADGAGARSGIGVAVDSGAARTTRTSELLVGVVAYRGVSTFISAPGFTRLGSAAYATGSARLGIVAEYKIVSPVGAYQVSGRLSSKQVWQAVAVTFFRS